jgi:hypothetical protein
MINFLGRPLEDNVVEADVDHKEDISIRGMMSRVKRNLTRNLKRNQRRGIPQSDKTTLCQIKCKLVLDER